MSDKEPDMRTFIRDEQKWDDHGLLWEKLDGDNWQPTSINEMIRNLHKRILKLEEAQSSEEKSHRTKRA